MCGLPYKQGTQFAAEKIAEDQSKNANGQKELAERKT